MNAIDTEIRRKGGTQQRALTLNDICRLRVDTRGPLEGYLLLVNFSIPAAGGGTTDVEVRIGKKDLEKVLQKMWCTEKGGKLIMNSLIEGNMKNFNALGEARKKIADLEMKARRS